MRHLRLLVGLLLPLFALLVLATSGAAEEYYVQGGFAIQQQADADVRLNQTIPGFLSPGGTTNLETKVGFGVAVAAGVHFDNGIRLELGYDYRRSDLDEIGTRALDGEIVTHSLLANAYYEAPLDGPLRPYIGVGLGFSLSDIEIDRFEGVTGTLRTEDDVQISYQLILGTSYYVSPELGFYAQFEALGLSDPDYGFAEIEYTSSNLEFGLKLAL